MAITHLMDGTRLLVVPLFSHALKEQKAAKKGPQIDGTHNEAGIVLPHLAVVERRKEKKGLILADLTLLALIAAVRSTGHKKESTDSISRSFFLSLSPSTH